MPREVGTLRWPATRRWLATLHWPHRPPALHWPHRPARLHWPRGRRMSQWPFAWVDIAWVVFSLANLVAMVVFSH